MTIHVGSNIPFRYLAHVLYRTLGKSGTYLAPLLSLWVLAYLFIEDTRLAANTIHVDSAKDTIHREDQSSDAVRPEITESLLTLFGTAQIQAVESSISAAPLTPLDITLKGAFTHSDPARAYALIDVNGKTSQYRVGDEVLAGAELVSVQTGQAVIRRNGQDELLVIDVLKNRHGASGAHAVSSSPPQAQLDESPPVAQADASQVYAPMQASGKSVSERLKELRERRSSPH